MANLGTIITGKNQMLKGGISQSRNKKNIIDVTLSLSFITIFVTSSITSEGGGEGADLLDKVVEFCSIPRTKDEIQRFCRLKSDRYVRQKVIQTLLNQGRLIRTIPDKLSSPKQKYIQS